MDYSKRVYLNNVLLYALTPFLASRLDNDLPQEPFPPYRIWTQTILNLTDTCTCEMKSYMNTISNDSE